jgi:hypothetical protein
MSVDCLEPSGAALLRPRIQIAISHPNPLRQFAFRAQTCAKSVDAGRVSPRGEGGQITGGRGLIGVEGPQHISLTPSPSRRLVRMVVCSDLYTPYLTCTFALEWARSGKVSTHDQTVVDQTCCGGWWSDIVVDCRGRGRVRRSRSGSGRRHNLHLQPGPGSIERARPDNCRAFQLLAGGAVRFASVPRRVAQSTEANGPRVSERSR